ncbi:MAG: hypothetical protein UE295_09280 [Acutalibacteraceae bacterium]|nr:hypothetical protein [Acutalibacteraceae bacterium]
MNYTFNLKRVFMYNQVLTISDGTKCYEAIVEDLPTDKPTTAIWLEDFELDSSVNIDVLKAELTEWFLSQNQQCIFNNGKSR